LQNAERDGEVVGGTFFANGGGGEINDDTFAGIGEAAVFDGGLDALAALFDSLIRESDNICARKTPRCIYFDFYDDTFETDYSARENTR
jgi:hypothetical protein